MDYDQQVLLVSAPSIIEASFASFTKNLYKPTEPLGLLYIAGNLRHNGIDVHFLDCNGEGLCLEESVKKIVSGRPRIVAISCLTQEAYMVEELLKKLRPLLPDSTIVMGNLHSSYFARYYLENGIADVVVHGEGEKVMVDLAQAILNKKPLFNVHGISFMDAVGSVIATPVHVIDDLDALPVPAWDLANLKNYKSPFYYNSHPNKTRIMVTSRGCPIGCTFCTIHEGQKVRFQSPERVIDEIKFLIREYGTTHINFLDPMFLSKPKRVMEICALIKSEGLQFRWSCEGHVNYAKPDLFKAMQEAGCETLFFGLESADDGLLRTIGKKTRAGQNAKAIHMADQAGIKPVGFFMLGLPGETEELTRKSIDFALSLPLDMAVFSITVPYPGSQMYKDLIENDDRFDELNWDGFSNTGVFGRNSASWSPDNLSHERLLYLQAEAMRRFHLRPRMILRHLITFKYARFGDIVALFSALMIVLKKSLFSRAVS